MCGMPFEPETTWRDVWHALRDERGPGLTLLHQTFASYFMTKVLDGCSRSVLAWGIGQKMEEPDIEIIVQRAREKYPGAHPRIISDNGPQFNSKDFKQFARLCGMTHVRLHSAIGYVTPHDMLAGRQQAIFDERDRKLEEARQQRAAARAAERASKLTEAACKHAAPTYTESIEAEDSP